MVKGEVYKESIRKKKQSQPQSQPRKKASLSEEVAVTLRPKKNSFDKPDVSKRKRLKQKARKRLTITEREKRGLKEPEKTKTRESESASEKAHGSPKKKPPKEKKKKEERSSRDRDTSKENTKTSADDDEIEDAIEQEPQYEFGEVQENFEQNPNKEEPYLRELLKKMNIPIIDLNIASFTAVDVRRMIEFVARWERIRINEVIRDPTAPSTNRYRVCDHIGQGRFSFVYASERPDCKTPLSIDNYVAIKVQKLHRLCSSGFKREIDILVKMRKITETAGPAAPRYFPIIEDAGICKNLHFIVMNVCGGGLDYLQRKALRRVKRLSMRTVVTLGIDMLKCIWELHKLGVIHRNIKPANFCVGLEKTNYRVTLIDFASACKLSRTQQGSDGGVSDRKKKSESQRGIKAEFFLRDRTTCKFWSAELHRHELVTRNSDVFSWMIIVLDLYNQRRLSWRRKPDREMLEEKLAFFFTNPEDRKLPKVLEKLFEAFKNTTNGVTNDHATPCYETLTTILVEERIKHNDLNYKPEWLRKLGSAEDANK